MYQQIANAVIIKNIYLFKNVIIHHFAIAKQGMSGAFDDLILLCQ